MFNIIQHLHTKKRERISIWNAIPLQTVNFIY